MHPNVHNNLAQGSGHLHIWLGRTLIDTVSTSRTLRVGLASGKISGSGVHLSVSPEPVTDAWIATSVSFHSEKCKL